MAEDPGDFSADELVKALFGRALMLGKYKTRATRTGYLELLCDECGDGDVTYGHVIWSAQNKRRQNYSIVELENIVSDHEHMVHRNQRGQDD